MTTMRGALMLGLSVLGALALQPPTPVLAQDKPVTMRLSHWVPPRHPLQPAIEGWAKSLEAASGGTIKSTVFPAEQLGKAFDHYDMVRDGIADGGYINPGYQPGRFPVIAAGELPFLIADATGGSKALDTWYREYAAAEMKDVKFCLAFVHDPGSFHSKKKIVMPEDVKGMKIRPAHATMGQFVSLLGGTNIQASAPEARDMLERGVADAITFPWGSILLFGIDKAVKYHIDAPLYATTFVWVFNKATYEKMSAAQKKAFDDHCTPEWAAKFAAPWAEFEADGRTKLKAAAGHEVYPLTADQVAAWRKAAQPLVAKWAEGVKKVGIDADKAMAALEAELKKAKASF